MQPLWQVRPTEPGRNTSDPSLVAVLERRTAAADHHEAQPDVTDQWNIPFFFSDARNVFYVTTTVNPESLHATSMG